jgi:hypothetical protein
MIRYFCDVCKEEIGPHANYVSERFKDFSIIDGTRIEVEIMAGTGGGLNKGHLCGKCLGKFLRFLFPEPAIEKAKGGKEG